MGKRTTATTALLAHSNPPCTTVVRPQSVEAEVGAVERERELLNEKGEDEGSAGSAAQINGATVSPFLLVERLWTVRSTRWNDGAVGTRCARKGSKIERGEEKPTEADETLMKRKSRRPDERKCARMQV
jgi:hypothetical protein